jgi:hypothetical protein
MRSATARRIPNDKSPRPNLRAIFIVAVSRATFTLLSGSARALLVRRPCSVLSFFTHSPKYQPAELDERKERLGPRGAPSQSPSWMFHNSRSSSSFFFSLSSTHAAVPHDVSGCTFHPLSTKLLRLPKAIMTLNFIDGGS